MHFKVTNSQVNRALHEEHCSKLNKKYFRYSSFTFLQLEMISNQSDGRPNILTRHSRNFEKNNKLKMILIISVHRAVILCQWYLQCVLFFSFYMYVGNMVWTQTWRFLEMAAQSLVMIKKIYFIKWLKIKHKFTWKKQTPN